MKKSPLRKISNKTRERNRKWGQITHDRINFLTMKYGYPLSEYSGKAGGHDGFTVLGGHHIDGNRNNCIPENCYICQWQEHQYIEDNNIQVSQEDFKSRELFL